LRGNRVEAVLYTSRPFVYACSVSVSLSGTISWSRVMSACQPNLEPRKEDVARTQLISEARNELRPLVWGF